MRTRSLVAVVIAALVALVCVPAPSARAGGAVFDLDAHYFVPGESVTGHTSVWLRSQGNGTAADGPYSAYLAPHGGTGRWPPRLTDRVIRLGPVELTARPGAAFGEATVRFTVPDVPPAAYELFVCNPGCEKTLGDTVPTYLEVVATRLEARVLARVEARFGSLPGTLAEELRGRIDGVEARSVGRDWAARMDLRLAGFRGEIDALRSDLAAARDRAPWWGVAGAAATLGVLVVAYGGARLVTARRRRRRALEILESVPAEPVPFELEPLDR